MGSKAICSRKVPLPVLLGSTLALLSPCSIPHALAQGSGPAQAWAQRGTLVYTIELAVDEARAIPVYGVAAKVFIANPEVADVESSNSSRLVFYGRKRGETTIIVTTRTGLELKYRIVVGRPVSQLLENLARLYPGNDLAVFDAPTGMTITGTMGNAGDADKVRKMVAQYLSRDETLNFNVQITGGEQVNLHVRILEVSRSASESLGINLSGLLATGSTQIGVLTGRNILPAAGTDLSTPPAADQLFNRSSNGVSTFGVRHADKGGTLAGTIDALKSRNLLRVLAEPNLTALSGETANFLAGGQIAVPTARGSGDNQQISIEWKDFGVSLKFTPVILDGNTISIKVNSEVSELSDVGATRMGSITIPSVLSRRVETTIKLGKGQSFAIAGLYNDRRGRSVDEVPGLARIPIIGELFRSRSFKSNNTELVVIVTPYIAAPVDAFADIPLPEDALEPGPSPLVSPPGSKARGKPAGSAPVDKERLREKMP